MGYKGDVVCCFCRGSIESREHLFFGCGFSKRIWREVVRKCLVNDPRTDWEEVQEWGVKGLKQESLKGILCKFSLGAVVYHIWKQRNDIRCGNNLKNEEQILKNIVWEVRSRVMAAGGRLKKSEETRELCCKWRISDGILC